MKVKLSDAVARTGALPAGKQELTLWDTDLVGFGLRMKRTAKGVSKRWSIQYRNALRKTTWFIIADVAEMGATEARKTAAKKLAGVRLGTYPEAEKNRRRREAEEKRDRNAETFGVVSKLYLDRKQQDLRERSFLEVKRHIEKHWAPFAPLPIHEITRRRVAIRMAEISAKNGPIAANRAKASLSAFFSWAIGEGMVEGNPVIGVNEAIAERPRDRVLTNAELAAIWTACRAEDYGHIVQLLTLLGQRREEVGGMLWSELDLEAGLWTMAGDRTKNDRRHVVPLTPEALDILHKVAGRPGRDGAEDHVFGNRGGFAGWSKAKLALDARITEVTGKPIAAWRLHDLRRTMKTRMADDLDVLNEISEALLNHAKKGMENVYNTAQYVRQKRSALEKWADYLKSITDGASRKVIPMRPKEVPA
jgi:integrase